MRGVIMVAVLIGSTLGGFVPTLWGASAFSVVGVVFSILGGIAGIWVGARVIVGRKLAGRALAEVGATSVVLSARNSSACTTTA